MGDRRFSQELVSAEKPLRTWSVLMNLSMARRSRTAVLITSALATSKTPPTVATRPACSRT